MGTGAMAFLMVALGFVPSRLSRLGAALDNLRGDAGSGRADRRASAGGGETKGTVTKSALPSLA